MTSRARTALLFAEEAAPLPEGVRHQHRCPRCDETWVHVAEPSWTLAEHYKAHTCPRCRYYGVETRIVDKRRP